MVPRKSHIDGATTGSVQEMAHSEASASNYQFNRKFTSTEKRKYFPETKRQSNHEKSVAPSSQSMRRLLGDIDHREKKMSKQGS